MSYDMEPIYSLNCLKVIAKFYTLYITFNFIITINIFNFRGWLLGNHIYLKVFLILWATWIYMVAAVCSL